MIKAHGRHFEDDLLEFGLVVGCGESQRAFKFLAHFFAPFLFANPALMSAVFPVGKILFRDGEQLRLAALFKIGDDGRIGQAVADHGVDFVANLFGEASDFALGPVGERNRRQRRTEFIVSRQFEHWQARNLRVIGWV